MSNETVFVRRKYDIIANNNKTISLDDKYDFISNPVNNHMIVTKNEKKGLINEQGEEIIPLMYDRLSFDSDDSTILRAERNGKVGFLGIDGFIKIPVIYSSISKRDDGLYICVLERPDPEGDYYMQLNYLMDITGKIFLNAKMTIIQYQKGIYYVEGINFEKTIYNQKLEKTVIEAGEYDDILFYGKGIQTEEFFGEDYILAQKKNRLYIVNTTTGKARKNSFERDVFFDDMWDCDGCCGSYSKEYIIVEIFRKKGVINRQGEFIIELTENIEHISFDRKSQCFRVHLHEYRNYHDYNSYGIYSKTGKVIVPLLYHSVAYDATIKMFLCEKDGKHGYYDLEGKLIVPVKYDSIQMDFERKIFMCNNKHKKFGYYNIEGELIVPVKYNEKRATKEFNKVYNK